MAFLDSVSGQLGINFSAAMITGIVWTISQLLIMAAVGIFFLKWYFDREKYNMNGEIWIINEGSITPQIERVKGGWFIEKGIREFRLLGKQYIDAVIKFNPKHLIRDGKKWRFWIRKEGAREYYSFFPRTWQTKTGNTTFRLEVEDGSIVNQAIIKDKLLRDRHTPEDKLKEYAPLIITTIIAVVLIIVSYFTYQYLETVIQSANSVKLMIASKL